MTSGLGLQRYSWAGQPLGKVLEIPGRRHYTPMAWAPDGRLVVGCDHRLLLWDGAKKEA